jgi:Right handed beta helix region
MRHPKERPLNAVAPQQKSGRKFMRIRYAVPLLTIAAAPAAHASVVAVGTCLPSATSVSTIQGAVSISAAGGTVKVCPGTYPEQIVITKNLTLEGISDGVNSTQAVIVPPSTGVVATNGIAAQIFAENAAKVTVENLTVDGTGTTGNGITGCGPYIIGIYYLNASGTIKANLVQNQVLNSPSLIGCQNGLGIFVDSSGGSSNVSVQSNVVENYQKNGITANDVGTNATITGNTVQGQGPTTGAAENSIQVGFGATATISSNIVGGDIWAMDTSSDTGDAAAGILVYASTGVSVTSNTVESTQYGISFSGNSMDGAADGGTVSDNKVGATFIFDGVDICANNASVTRNTIVGSVESAIHADSSCFGASTGDSISGNKINGACAGILEGVGSTPTLGTNTFVNTANNILSGTDACPVPGPDARRPGHAAARPHAVRLRH